MPPKSTKAPGLAHLKIFSYANSRHSYSFPRVVGMLGDGQTAYDSEQDGERTKIGACSVSPFAFSGFKYP